MPNRPPICLRARQAGTRQPGSVTHVPRVLQLHQVVPPQRHTDVHAGAQHQQQQASKRVQHPHIHRVRLCPGRSIEQQVQQ